MKKLRKIKLNIEKDIVSTLSKEEQIEIKGGSYLMGCGTNGCGGSTRDCTAGCFQPSVGVECVGSNGCGVGGTNGCPSNNCATGHTCNCPETGGKVSLVHGYNCYTIYSVCGPQN